jgi:hypothetical protein
MNTLMNIVCSLCIYFGNSKASTLLHHRTDFEVCGNKIENVDSWPHLGHVVTSDLSDAKDIQSRCRSMIGQINKVLCLFSKLDTVTRNRLFTSYCSSFYGCEFWDLCNKEVAALCTTWMKGARLGGRALVGSGHFHQMQIAVSCVLLQIKC